jgi:hypothetical protein
MLTRKGCFETTFFPNYLYCDTLQIFTGRKIFLVQKEKGKRFDTNIRKGKLEKSLWSKTQNKKPKFPPPAKKSNFYFTFINNFIFQNSGCSFFI